MDVASVHKKKCGVVLHPEVNNPIVKIDMHFWEFWQKEHQQGGKLFDIIR